jgi:hypothetical protein
VPSAESEAGNIGAGVSVEMESMKPERAYLREDRAPPPGYDVGSWAAASTAANAATSTAGGANISTL